MFHEYIFLSKISTDNCKGKLYFFTYCHLFFNVYQTFDYNNLPLNWIKLKDKF